MDQETLAKDKEMCAEQLSCAKPDNNEQIHWKHKETNLRKEYWQNVDSHVLFFL